MSGDPVGSSARGLGITPGTFPASKPRQPQGPAEGVPCRGTPHRSGGLLAWVNGALAWGNHRASSLCQAEQGLCGEAAKGSEESAAREVAVTRPCKVFMGQDVASRKSGFKK